ncbi:MAG: Trm112 family protein [Acidimicrobiia bacterium]|nr:Trm112 family protein [Acidimicrobiia bacterium]
MTLHSDLLAILACTECKGRLVYFADREFLFCPSCRLRYAVADEIPMMRPEDGVAVDPAESEHLLEEARELDLDNVPDA